MAKKLKKTTTVNFDKSMEEVISGMQLRMMQDLSEEQQEVVSEIVWGTRKKICKMIPLHEARIVAQKHILEEAEDERAEAQSKLEEHNKFLAKKRDEKQKAIEELVNARKKLEKANQTLRAAEKVNEQFSQQLKKAEENCQHQNNSLEQMLEIALVHSTASIKQISQHQLAEILVTKSEESSLEFLLPDGACDFDSDVNFVEYLPRGFKERYDEETRKRIIDYCNLVINFKLATDSVDEKHTVLKIIPLYGNTDIAEILRINGFDFD